MNERIKWFIEKLKNELKDLPAEETEEAVRYYEEYLFDAMEAGKDMDEVILGLDSPEKVAGKIKTEISIIRAKQNPGLKNLGAALKNAFHLITKPFSALFMLIFIVMSYGLVLTFFVAAFTSLVGAAAVFFVLIYEALKIPSRFSAEIIGSIGAALFGGGMCFVTAYGFYKLARLFIRISAILAGMMVKKSGEQLRQIKQKPVTGKLLSRRLLFSGLAVLISGIILFTASGLPYKFFIIFNSMKPGPIAVSTSGYNPALENIKSISVSTAHSHIHFSYNNSDKIIVSYEQPDWLDFNISTDGGTLYFKERSNGRLPLFELVSMHESITRVSVSIPAGFNPEIISFESKGGYVYLENPSENIDITTYTGGITLEQSTAIKTLSISAITESGSIYLNGIPAGHSTSRGIEYSGNAPEKDKTIRLKSSRGTININAK